MLLRRVMDIVRSQVPRLPNRQERADRREARKYTELERLRLENPDAAFELDLERALSQAQTKPPTVAPKPKLAITYGPSAWATHDDV